MNDQTVSANPVDSGDSPAQVAVAARPTQTHYYEIVDGNDEKRAALAVILNAQMRVIHAELWFYDRFRTAETIQAEIYRRARQIIENDYLGSGFESELRVLDGAPLDEEMIKHRNPDPRYRADRRIHIWPYVTGYAAAVLILLFFLLLNRTVLQPNRETVAAINNAQPSTQRTISGDDAASTEQTALAAEEVMPPADTNGLPPSVMADPQLQVGMTARILPGYRSFVRTEPGPDAGEPVGVLENGATALLLGGPAWKEGNTDTIVWWYVETETGVRGWTPANTSELTLLEPAE